MASNGRVSLILQDVPSAIARCVEDRAEAQGISRDRLLSRLLSERYGVEVPEPRAYSRPETELVSDTWVVRVPSEVRAMVRAEAKDAGASIRALLLSVLAEECGLQSTALKVKVEG